MPRLYVSSRGHVGVGFGCLGALFYAFAYLFMAFVIVGAIGAVLALFLLALLIAWAGVGIDALLRKSSGSYRAKRLDRGKLRWPKNVENAMGSAMSLGKRPVRCRR
jgi:hypothetical protein